MWSTVKEAIDPAAFLSQPIGSANSTLVVETWNLQSLERYLADEAGAVGACIDQGDKLLWSFLALDLTDLKELGFCEDLEWLWDARSCAENSVY